jgi:hypothetical protein
MPTNKRHDQLKEPVRKADQVQKPAFARYLIPKQTGLKRELETYLWHYNTDRAHIGRHNNGRTPEEVIGKTKIYERR